MGSAIGVLLVIGVLLLTLLERRFVGRGAVFGLMLLVQVIPFQLLTIPLYVMIVRSYGLADSYLGMIAPFAINSTAVFVFRQVALPLVKLALLTFIGPWNEFLWPFLITKQQDLQPLAMSLSNYLTTVSARAANPFGAPNKDTVFFPEPVPGPDGVHYVFYGMADSKIGVVRLDRSS